LSLFPFTLFPPFYSIR